MVARFYLEAIWRVIQIASVVARSLLVARVVPFFTCLYSNLFACAVATVNVCGEPSKKGLGRSMFERSKFVYRSLLVVLPSTFRAHLVPTQGTGQSVVSVKVLVRTLCHRPSPLLARPCVN